MSSTQSPNMYLKTVEMLMQNGQDKSELGTERKERKERKRKQKEKGTEIIDQWEMVK
jgi:hypothetical protein